MRASMLTVCRDYGAFVMFNWPVGNLPYDFIRVNAMAGNAYRVNQELYKMCVGYYAFGGK